MNLNYEFEIRDAHNELLITVPIRTTFFEDATNAQHIADDIVKALNNHDRLMKENALMKEALEGCQEILEYFVNKQRGQGVPEDDRIGIGDLRNVKKALKLAEGS